MIYLLSNGSLSIHAPLDFKKGFIHDVSTRRVEQIDTLYVTSLHPTNTIQQDFLELCDLGLV